MSTTLTETELKRLRQAVDAADRGIQPFRNQKREALREYYGSQYGDLGARCLTPVNLIRFATEVFTTSLAAGTPQALVTTLNREYQTAARDLEIALNTVSKRLLLGQVVNEATFDALYGIGVIRTGRTLDSRYGMPGFSKTKGHPYAVVVSFDDFVFDTQATSWRSVAWMGNRYRMSLEAAQNTKSFNASERKKLVKTELTHQQKTGEERVSGMSRPDRSDVEEFQDHVELLDIYLCDEKRILTINTEGEQHLLLRDVPYTGTENGPYHTLLLDRPSEQLVPAAKAWQWLDLHWLVNDLYRKAAEDAINSKTVPYGMPGAAKDASVVHNARNGDFVTIANPQGLGLWTIPGADQATLLMAMQAKQLFNQLFGNPEMLAGVAAQSDTFGQDQLISSAANRMVGGMEDRVIEFAQSVLSAIGYEILNNGSGMKLALEKPIAGTGETVPFTYTSDRVAGSLLDYQISVEPYSLQRMTPAMRLRALNDLVMNVVIPAREELRAEGGAFSVQKYVSRYSRLAGIQNEVDDLITYSDPEAASVGADQSRAPAMTTRRTIREGRRAPGNDSNEAIMAALTNGMQSNGRNSGRMAG